MIEPTDPYERGFIDGMAKQRDSAVQRFVESGTPDSELAEHKRIIREQQAEIEALHKLVKEQDMKIINLSFDVAYANRRDEWLNKERRELTYEEIEQEPVAIRYDFDGYGYKYMDSGTGSDWQTRVQGEPLYTAPPQIEVGCAECGVNGGHALYCVECAEKFVGLENENRSILIRTLKWCEDLLREAGHDEAVNEVQDCIMLLRKAQGK